MASSFENFEVASASAGHPLPGRFVGDYFTTACGGLRGNRGGGDLSGADGAGGEA